MRTRAIAGLSCALVVIVLCGCQSHNAAVEARLQHNIDRCHQDFRARFPIWRRCATNILSVLSSANAVTLKTPQFASAAIGRDQDGEYRLYVYWLEDAPSVDGVELSLAKTNSTAILAVSASDTERNIKDSKVSVVFVASWIWPSTNSICKKLDQINDVSSIKVRLLKAGTPVTDWCPVSFYRLDHWMASKEVTEVTTGPSANMNGSGLEK